MRLESPRTAPGGGDPAGGHPPPPAPVIGSDSRHCPTLERLRGATRRLHDAIEATGASTRILAPHVRPDAYRDFLLRTMAVVAPTESWLTQACAAAGLSDPAGGTRTPALAADIRALGGGTPPPETAAVTEATLAEVAAGRGAVLGCLYVLEGSALGGTMIARHITAAFAGDGVDCTRFHSGQGLRAGDRWRAIRALLSGLDDGAELAAAERTAVGLFQCFLTAYSADATGT